MPLPLVSTSTTRSAIPSSSSLILTRITITIGIAFLLLLSLSSSSSSLSSSFGVSSFAIQIPTPRSTRTRATTSTSPLLFVSSNDNNENNVENKGGEESEDDFQRRMAIVRSLQMSFYGSSAVKPKTEAETKDEDNDSAAENNITDGVPEYNIDTGSIERLSLFRAAWHELPGRSNVLIIRDPVYTNMFERMFYTHTYSNNKNKKKSPWMMFGHLYMPKDFFGDKTKYPLLSNNDKKYKLSTWNETNYNKRSTISADSAVVALSSTAVLGTLMYVRDYRRLKDGRILVLVHASERFVIDQIYQEIPYSIVDVKLLPDIEELHEVGVGVGLSSSKDNDDGDGDEQMLLDRIINEDESLNVGPARNKAIQESIQKYHSYECNPHQQLDGIPSKSDLSIADITHDAISSVLPYCPFNDDDFNFDDNNNNNDDNNKQGITTSNAAVAAAKVTEEEETTPSLELQLLLKGIMKIPPSDKRFNYGSSNDDNGSSTTALWTTDELEFELWKIVDEFLMVTNKTNSISPLLLELRSNQNQNYPNHRRQRRFSYSVAYLLESILPIGITTTSTSTSTSTSTGTSTGNLNEGRYSDNFRNGGRRYSSSNNNKSNDKATTTKTTSSSSSTSTTKGNNNGNGNNIDHDSYSDYLMDINEIQQFRSILLSIPSTRERLRFVLETFYQWRFYL